MYTLGAGIWQRLRQRTNYYVVIVGLDNAGKTTFLEQIKSRFVKNYEMLNPLKITSTVGLNVGTIIVGSTRLNFWDLGGQEELQSLWHKYFEDSQALIFVVDSCDPDRFSEVGKTFKLIMNSEAVQKMPILVVCNKIDMEECMGTEIIRVLTSDDRHIGDLALITISALQGLNIERCIRWLCTVLNTEPLLH
uniref:ADP-ribosylation factor-related protein 1 n=1 Tax=Setaria digitata TaxID=48799 RepID=A0A915Q533_9BILA